MNNKISKAVIVSPKHPSGKVLYEGTDAAFALAQYQEAVGAIEILAKAHSFEIEEIVVVDVTDENGASLTKRASCHSVQCYASVTIR